MRGFGDIVEDIRRKPYDLLDASKTVFDRDFLEFSVHIHDLELAIHARPRSSTAKACCDCCSPVASNAAAALGSSAAAPAQQLMVPAPARARASSTPASTTSAPPRPRSTCCSSSRSCCSATRSRRGCAPPHCAAACRLLSAGPPGSHFGGEHDARSAQRPAGLATRTQPPMHARPSWRVLTHARTCACTPACQHAECMRAHARHAVCTRAHARHAV
jgi:hypothetical protein